MSFFSSLFGSTPWDLDTVASPWGDRPSIYEHVRAHVRPEGPGFVDGGVHVAPVAASGITDLRPLIDPRPDRPVTIEAPPTARAC